LPIGLRFIKAPSKIFFDRKGISSNISGDTIIITNSKNNMIIALQKITGDLVVTEK